MSVSGISQASGAGVLALYAQSTGNGGTNAASASANQLKTAIAEAQMSEAALVSSSGSNTRTQLNVYG
jgi:hypothetical protein